MKVPKKLLITLADKRKQLQNRYFHAEMFSKKCLFVVMHTLRSFLVGFGYP